MYRVAANYLSTARKSRIEEQTYSFERFGRELDEGLSDGASSANSNADEVLLLQEIRVGCTLGMLLCLERTDRLVYILGEILDLDGREAAAVLDMQPAAFRQRLSRSRRTIMEFTAAKCGLVNPDNPCRCRKRVEFALASKRIDRRHLLFANDAEQARNFPQLLATIRSLRSARRAVALYRSHPEQPGPATFAAEIRNLVERITPG
jgi:hypothetical protein